MTETFVKERKHNLTGKVEKVTIDDACTFFGRYMNGSLANFESTRYARGHKAQYTFEINGEHASISWDLHDLHRLQYFDYSDEGRVRGWRSIHVTDSDHPYMDKWWVPGLQIGYDQSFTHQVADFLTALGKGEQAGPTFRDGLRTQYVLDAITESAASLKLTEVKKILTPRSPVLYRAIPPSPVGVTIMKWRSVALLIGVVSLLGELLEKSPGRRRPEFDCLRRARPD